MKIRHIHHRNRTRIKRIMGARWFAHVKEQCAGVVADCLALHARWLEEVAKSCYIETASGSALDELAKLHDIDSTAVIREELRTQFARICAAAQVPEHMLHGHSPKENDK